MSFVEPTKLEKFISIFFVHLGNEKQRHNLTSGVFASTLIWKLNASSASDILQSFAYAYNNTYDDEYCLNIQHLEKIKKQFKQLVNDSFTNQISNKIDKLDKLKFVTYLDP